MSLFLGSAVTAASLVTYLFHNMYFLSESADLLLLAALFATTVISLLKGYQYTESTAAVPTAAGQRVRGAEERAWFAVLSQNMRFLAVFFFFAYVVAPQLESRELPRFPWVHAVVSIAPAALVVFFSDRV